MPLILLLSLYFSRLQSLYFFGRSLVRRRLILVRVVGVRVLAHGFGPECGLVRVDRKGILHEEGESDKCASRETTWASVFLVRPVTTSGPIKYSSIVCPYKISPAPGMRHACAQRGHHHQWLLLSSVRSLTALQTHTIIIQSSVKILENR